jgi:hypothetical protein
MLPVENHSSSSGIRDCEAVAAAVGPMPLLSTNSSSNAASAVGQGCVPMPPAPAIASQPSLREADGQHAGLRMPPPAPRLRQPTPTTAPAPPTSSAASQTQSQPPAEVLAQGQGQGHAAQLSFPQPRSAMPSGWCGAAAPRSLLSGGNQVLPAPRPPPPAAQQPLLPQQQQQRDLRKQALGGLLSALGPAGSGLMRGGVLGGPAGGDHDGGPCAVAAGGAAHPAAAAHTAPVMTGQQQLAQRHSWGTAAETDNPTSHGLQARESCLGGPLDPDSSWQRHWDERRCVELPSRCCPARPCHSWLPQAACLCVGL